MASQADKTPEEPPVACNLTLDRVCIRPYTLADAPAASHNANDPDIAKQMRNTFPQPYELKDSEWFIANRANRPHTFQLDATAEGPQKKAIVHHAIIRRSDGIFMGGIGLKPCSDVESRTMEMGYWIGREFWGQGFVPEAVRGFCKWCFETFPQLQRLEATVFEGNQASVAVLAKVGFQAEGVRRKAIWKNGKTLDELHFGMIKSECPGLSPPS